MPSSPRLQPAPSSPAKPCRRLTHLPWSRSPARSAVALLTVPPLLLFGRQHAPLQGGHRCLQLRSPADGGRQRRGRRLAPSGVQRGSRRTEKLDATYSFKWGRVMRGLDHSVLKRVLVTVTLPLALFALDSPGTRAEITVAQATNPPPSGPPTKGVFVVPYRTRPTLRGGSGDFLPRGNFRHQDDPDSALSPKRDSGLLPDLRSLLGETPPPSLPEPRLKFPDIPELEPY
jgi:hypothetical protein